MTAFYNEHDRKAAAWLRELIKANLIASGVVDERNIEEIDPSELEGFTQCHFFAGIGVWSWALRAAGWADDSAVWTGSCPCQPFSASGQGEGFSDKRHVWPAWFRLIRECHPDVIFGEQVASKAGLAWFDIVSADLEGEGYTIGATDLCAAGVGAPHIRQRLFFVADAQRARGMRESGSERRTQRGPQAGRESEGSGLVQTRDDIAAVLSVNAAGIRRQQRGARTGPTAQDIIAPPGQPRPEPDRQLQGHAGRLGATGDGAHAELDGGRPDLSKWETQEGTADGRDCSTVDSPNATRRRREQRDEGERDVSVVDQDSTTGRSADTDGGNSEPERQSGSREHGLVSEDSGAGLSGDASRGGLGMRGPALRRTGQPAQPDPTGERRNPTLGGSGTYDRESRSSHEPQEPTGGPSTSSDHVDAQSDRPQSQPTAGERRLRIPKPDGTGEAGGDLHALEPRLEGQPGNVREWRGPGWLDPHTARSIAEAGATRGHWGDCDWWYGRDGKYRPIEPGLFPLVTGAPSRVGRLRGYGNAIVAPLAQAFIEAYMSLERW